MKHYISLFIIISSLGLTWFTPVNAIGIDANQAAIVQYSGSSTSQRVDEAHAGLGDVNGDGYDDFGIAVATGGNQGLMIVYGQLNPVAGGSNFSQPNSVLYTAGRSYGFGTSIAGVGDVNNDGYDDVLVGASTYSRFPGSIGGAAYLIFGSSNLVGGNFSSTTDDYIIFASPENGSYTGQAVSAAGDVNRDGKADFLIAAPSYQANLGAVYLVYGKEMHEYDLNGHETLLNNVNGEKKFEGSTNAYLGSSVSPAGDVDNDGCSDFLLGAPTKRIDGAYSRGAVYLVYGGNSSGVCDGTMFSGYSYQMDLLTTTSYVAQISGTAEAMYVGTIIAGNGDVNGDHVSDFSIGSVIYPGQRGVRYASGYIGANGYALGSLSVYSPRIQSMNGDLNHDGYDDLLWYHHRSGENLDQTTVLYGESDLSRMRVSNSLVHFEYAGAQGYYSLSTFVGDINNDGDDDFVISDGQLRPPVNPGYGMANLFYSVIDQPTLNGSTRLETECGVEFNDPGASATDSYSGATLTAATSALSTAVTGTYTRNYTITNYLNRLSNSIARTVVVLDRTAPVITMAGSASMSVDQGSTFIDPGATAIDACMGNATVTTAGSVNTTEPGTYTLTYRSTDNSGNVSETYRTVQVIIPTPQPTPAPVTTEPPATTPELNEPVTNEPELTEEELANLDVHDEATRDELLDSIEIGDDGDLTVHLDNGQEIHIIVSPDDTGEGMLVELLSDTGAILVVTPKAKYVKLINPFTGEILDTYKLSKNGWKEKHLKLKDLRTDGLTDVILTTKKSSNGMLGLIRLNKPKLLFTKKAKTTLENKSLAVSKTKAKLNVLILRNQKGKALLEYKLTKKYKLTAAD